MKFSNPTNSQSKRVHRVIEKKKDTKVGMIKKTVKITAIGKTRAYEYGLLIFFSDFFTFPPINMCNE